MLPPAEAGGKVIAAWPAKRCHDFAKSGGHVEGRQAARVEPRSPLGIVRTGFCLGLVFRSRHS